MSQVGTDRSVMSVDPGAFARFVAALPERFEPMLVRDDTVSTAFYEASQAGWSEEQLAADAMQALLGKDGGVGLVVHRLRGLSQSRPAQRQVPAPSRGRRYTAQQNLSYLRPGEVAERMRFIRDLPGSGLSADESEQGMQDLIDEQRARRAAE